MDNADEESAVAPVEAVVAAAAAAVTPAPPLVAPPVPAALTLGKKTKSVEPTPAPAPPPQELRRYRSEPPYSQLQGRESQRFTDRLLQLLTSATAPAPLLERTPSVPAGEAVCKPMVEEAPEPAEFGRDPPPRATAGPRRGTCGICMEENDFTIQLCADTQCEWRFCRDCVGNWAKEKVSGALYAVPWLNCPGCNGRVPTSAWSTCSPEAFSMYENNAMALLTFRCSSCHDVGSLHVNYVDEEASEFLERLKDHSSCPSILSLLDKLKEAWPSYATASAAPESILDLLPGTTSPFFKLLLSGITDIERRTCLHLASLRRNPFIYTPCCDSEFCFKCKVGTHHEDVSCEERQREELDIHCQFCPGCEVPTVRTEGCDHIVCVCGAEWTWRESLEAGYALGPASFLGELLHRGELDPNWSDTEEEENRTLLHYTIMEGRKENAELLLHAAANVNAEDLSGMSVLFYALGVASSYNSEMVDLVLEHKAEVSRQDPFRWLRSSGNLDGFRRVLEISGVGIEETDEGVSLMQIALTRGRVAVVYELMDGHCVKPPAEAPFLLLKSSANDMACFDALLRACACSGDGLRDLVVASMDLNKTNCAAHFICKHNAPATFLDVARNPGVWPNGAVISIDVFNALVAQGRNVWETDPNGKVLLLPLAVRQIQHACAQTSSYIRSRFEEEGNALITRLLELWDDQATAFAQSAHGADLVLEAVFARTWSIATRLVESKAGLEAQDSNGNTPLLAMLSSQPVSLLPRRSWERPRPQPNREEDMKMVQLLLKARADVLHRNKENKTVVNLAERGTWKESADLIQRVYDEAVKEQAKRDSMSGDGSVDNVGIKLDGQVQCPDCKQRFNTTRARDIHWRFIHDPNRHQED